MCFFGNLEHLAQIHPARFKSFGFLAEKHRVKHHAVADDIGLPVLEYARRNRTQYIFLAFEFESVASVGAALETCHSVIARSQHVHYFSFSFVAPLEP